MIEVEKKFIAKSDEVERLARGASFLGERKNIDVYYDTADYALTKKDIWLRMRSGKFELKFPIGMMDKARKITAYDEIENDIAICEKLGISVEDSLERSLVSLGYLPFAKIVTKRLKYEKDDFHIDVDEADFGYSLFEIELMVSSEAETEDAYRRILDFAALHGIPAPEKRSRGKVIEYIKRNNPDHFHALEKAWGIEL